MISLDHYKTSWIFNYYFSFKQKHNR
jgi:hypothetical protein